MIKKVGIGISTIVALTILVGCGDSSSDNNSSDNSSSGSNGIGHYVDSPVGGVDYLCGNNSGVTDKNGTFKFETNKGCEFKLGNIVLKKVPSDELFDGKTVIENNITIAQVLQSLDDDGNASNGITIKDDIKKKFIKQINATVLPTNEAELSVALQNIDKNLVDRDKAKEHLIENTKKFIKKEFAGKTFYIVEEGKDDMMREYTFDENVSSVKVISIKGSNLNKKYDISLDKPNILKIGLPYKIDINKDIKKNYIIIESPSFGFAKGDNYRMYKSKAKAEAYLKSLEDKDEHSNQNSGFKVNVIDPANLYGKTIKFNNGQSYLKFNTDSKSVIVNDGHESSDGDYQDWVYENGEVVIWKGKSWQYSFALGGDLKVGTKVRIKERGGKEVKYSTISSIK